MSPPRGPHWRNPGQRPVTLPGVEPEPPKLKPGRDYIGEAEKALKSGTTVTSAMASNYPPLTAAVIIAQALDRLGETMVQAASVANYKR